MGRVGARRANGGRHWHAVTVVALQVLGEIRRRLDGDARIHERIEDGADPALPSIAGGEESRVAGGAREGDGRDQIRGDVIDLDAVTRASADRNGPRR